MRTCSTATPSAAVLTTLLFAFSTFARDRSAMNGTWTLVPARSDFAGQPVLQTGTVTINDRQSPARLRARVREFGPFKRK